MIHKKTAERAAFFMGLVLETGAELRLVSGGRALYDTDINGRKNSCCDQNDAKGDQDRFTMAGRHSGPQFSGSICPVIRISCGSGNSEGFCFPKIAAAKQAETSASRKLMPAFRTVFDRHGAGLLPYSLLPDDITGGFFVKNTFA